MAAPTTPSRRILIIDDSEVLLTRMKRALIVAGHEVVTTTQIVGNARHLASCDLVIVDYHMPGLNGSAVVQSLRSSVLQSGKHTAAFYLYTSDKGASSDHVRLGFDGAFTAKGDDAELVRQVAAYFRLAATRLLRKPEVKAG